MNRLDELEIQTWERAWSDTYGMEEGAYQRLCKPVDTPPRPPYPYDPFD
jgi:hypothetical protein